VEINNPSFVILGHRPEDPGNIQKINKFNTLRDTHWILGTAPEDDDWRLGGVKPDSYGSVAEDGEMEGLNGYLNQQLIDDMR